MGPETSVREEGTERNGSKGDRISSDLDFFFSV